MTTFDQLEMFINNIIEKDWLKLTAFSKDTMRHFELSGRIKGYKKGLEAVKKINQAESYKDVLNTAEEQINQYKKSRANSVMESNADPDSFDKKMKIIFYDNAIDALVSAEAAIKSLLP